MLLFGQIRRLGRPLKVENENVRVFCLMQLKSRQELGLWHANNSRSDLKNASANRMPTLGRYRQDPSV